MPMEMLSPIIRYCVHVWLAMGYLAGAQVGLLHTQVLLPLVPGPGMWQDRPDAEPLGACPQRQSSPPAARQSLSSWHPGADYLLKG